MNEKMFLTEKGRKALSGWTNENGEMVQRLEREFPGLAKRKVWLHTFCDKAGCRVELRHSPAHTEYWDCTSEGEAREVLKSIIR